MKKTSTLLALMALSLTALTFTACDKDEETAEENITTIEVHLTGANGLDQKFFWNDTDGDGAANTIDTIQLDATLNNVQAHIHVYDRSVTPELDITEEIEEEGVDHLITYTVSGAALTIANLNTDANGAPLGITSTWATGAAGKGSLNIRLFHEPTDKTNAANPGGSVDFDVTFPVVVR
jgi:hypothetical protein